MIQKGGYMCWKGAKGPLGVSSADSYVIVPIECKYCKLEWCKTREQAEDFIEENSRIRNVVIITEREYVEAWNKRFYN